MFRLLVLVAALSAAAPVSAATISGAVTDTTGAALTNARVTLRDIATGREIVADTDAQGRYSFDVTTVGTYLVIVRRPGFSEAARTVVVEQVEAAHDVPVVMALGMLSSEVSVTATLNEREVAEIPLHVETLSRAGVEQTNPLSTGDALTLAPNVTPVGSGPFAVRPRLRGLDSTRLLVLVDGERLNTARQATDRTGAEVGLVSTDAINRVEIINGAGTLMYGSDALAGTVNIVTNEPQFSPSSQWLYGFNGYYSSNENGARGTMTLGHTSPRAAFRIQAGAEQFDNYEAGDFDTEDTRPLFADGTLNNADTIDDNFGFSFNAFPDPFNQPYVRTDGEILNSQAEGKFVSGSGLIRMGERRSLRVRVQSRHMDDVGFPDFEQPFFFNDTKLPFSNFDKLSLRYEAQDVTPWLANLALTGYYQNVDRMLQTTLPVQFPAPTPAVLFPIAVMRLDILSETRQRVFTPGVGLNAVILPARDHMLTAGLTFYQDNSRDERTTTTTTSMVGQVALGARGPAPVVFPSPVRLGPASVAHPVRVPNAYLRNIALFAQDEWRVKPNLSVIAGLRGDFYTVATEATPGYDVQSIIGNATPTVDPAKLPDPDGARYTRQALTGDIGIVSNADGVVSPFVRFGRSYRHPNLEEMLFAGPATIGSLVPNVTVEPETGNNFDAGVKLNTGRFSGGAFYFLNHYQNFIAQDLVVAVNSSGPLAQSRNFGDVRVTGVELSGAMPFTFSPGVVTLTGAAAFTRGTITEGTNPLDNSSLAGTPFDNITPSKVVANARFTESRGRWWVEYGIRAQGEVTRVAETLLDSPFLIAQDLLSLQGINVQRLGWGLNLSRGRDRVGLTFAIENLTDNYYREQFQFAPARGRSFTIGLNIGAF
ncbi:MAG TPA: TonB-dependent receptor [Vicinamibacterales bacterium]|nr:TonB-dependent receptor [Vicinamibacterales bacterium]